MSVPACEWVINFSIFFNISEYFWISFEYFWLIFLIFFWRSGSMSLPIPGFYYDPAACLYDIFELEKYCENLWWRHDRVLGWRMIATVRTGPFCIAMMTMKRIFQFHKVRFWWKFRVSFLTCFFSVFVFVCLVDVCGRIFVFCRCLWLDLCRFAAHDEIIPPPPLRHLPQRFSQEFVPHFSGVDEFRYSGWYT